MNSGAIIHSIYEILKTNDSLDKSFNSKFIFDNYIKMSNKEEIIEVFNKRNTTKIKTFENTNSIYGWLYKHTFFKKIFWFTKSEKRGHFTLKKDLIKRLEEERSKNEF